MVFDWLTLESSQRQKPKLIMHCFLPSLSLPGGALLLSVHMSRLPFFLSFFIHLYSQGVLVLFTVFGIYYSLMSIDTYVFGFWVVCYGVHAKC